MITFLINPASSSGSGEKVWQQVEEVLKSRNVEYEAIRLSIPGEAALHARSLTSDGKEHTLIVVGGDGTINECISGISHFDRCIFGCIPNGSGNDFVRGMKLVKDPKEAVEAILSPKKIRSIHIGLVSNSEKTARFAVSSGIGYDAAVCYEATRSRMKTILNRIHLGKLVYTLTALRMLIKMKPVELRLIADDKKLLTFKRAYFVAAMNNRYEGGGYMFCPEADPEDDMLDLMIAEGIPKPLVMLSMPLAMKGWHTRIKGIHILRCRKAVLTADSKAHVHTDGEHFDFCRKITWTMTKETLRVISG